MTKQAGPRHPPAGPRALTPHSPLHTHTVRPNTACRATGHPEKFNYLVINMLEVSVALSSSSLFPSSSSSSSPSSFPFLFPPASSPQL
ncbi:hypothetical protein E2C01_095343 [Portunus trituberculatus]|uniref:Uncharacterized protein n=1 Tax=Portunus trituberculatus TaxID=210409 RepID=A0A5B7K3Z4_PORTR|nr:hypothetical protein [Portunus trituberculatus]